LLLKDKQNRLGKEKDVDEVLGHAWFNSIDVEKLMERKLTPPYIPNIKDDNDTSNFDEKFQRLEV
jgi:hypothetical protein